MDIYLVRHAKSAHDPTKWNKDAVRPLAQKGIDRQTKASKGMQAAGIIYETIWVSPYRRAQETLQIIQDIYNSSINPLVVDELKVWGSSKKVMQLLEEHGDQHPEDKLLLVGHNPNMSNLVDLLVELDINMQTSDLVHVVYNNNGFELVKYYPRQDLYDLM